MNKQQLSDVLRASLSSDYEIASGDYDRAAQAILDAEQELLAAQWKSYQARHNLNVTTVTSSEEICSVCGHHISWHHHQDPGWCLAKVGEFFDEDCDCVGFDDH